MTKREKYCIEILEYLQEYDIREVTMDQIAEKLGITKRTLYNYFGDKFTMLSETMDYHIQTNMAYIQKIGADQSLNAVEVQTALVRFTLSEHKDQSPIFVRSIYEHYPQIFDHCDTVSRAIVEKFFIDNITLGRRQGLFHEDFDPLVISGLAFHAMESVRNELLSSRGHTMDYREVFKQIVFCIMRGIVTPKGSVFLEEEIKQINKL